VLRQQFDQMIFFSEKSLRRVVDQYILHFHHERPRSAALVTNHQGLDNVIPFPSHPLAESQSGLIVKSERRMMNGKLLALIGFVQFDFLEPET